jgi:3-hydroxyisobutyrate dehydrogenase-like beta-hydroxyacid dehydrogenase
LLNRRRKIVNKENVGILHPGQMGISIAASAQNSGNDVFWASEGRSPESLNRAQKYHLHDSQNLARLSETCSILLCVCPPHAAEDVAKQVAAQHYQGLYVDANAISPQRTLRIAQDLTDAGILFVDGGIIGGPAWEPGRTWLYLSGEQAERIANCFSAGPLETQIIGDAIGKASALKMCYAAYTKGTTALLTAILATAESLQVRAELENQWERNWPDFPEQTTRRVKIGTSRAWRFAGEMDEISSTFTDAGLPGGFHAAAADLYRRISQFKDDPSVSLEVILDALLQSSQSTDR